MPHKNYYLSVLRLSNVHSILIAWYHEATPIANYHHSGSIAWHRNVFVAALRFASWRGNPEALSLWYRYQLYLLSAIKPFGGHDRRLMLLYSTNLIASLKSERKCVTSLFWMKLSGVISFTEWWLLQATEIHLTSLCLHYRSSKNVRRHLARYKKYHVVTNHYWFASCSSSMIWAPGQGGHLLFSSRNAKWKRLHTKGKIVFQIP